MSVEALLRSAVLGYDPLAALISDGLSPEGFRAQEAPLDQDTGYPALCFQRIATGYGYTHGGRTDVHTVRMQWDCWAQTPEGASDLADALIKSFDTFDLSAEDESPPVVRRKPNFVLTRLVRPDTEAEPPIFRVIVDARHYVREQ